MSLSKISVLLPILLLAACAEPQDPPSDLLVLTTGNVFGYIEPCGCVAGQIGGIDRILSYVRQQRAAHPASLFLDSGDLFAKDMHPDESLRAQLPLKAEAFFKAWAAVDCEALAVGETDLDLGVETLLALSEQHAVPLLCGNLAYSDGSLVFPESLIVERAGKRIGIFSLLAPQLIEAKVKSPGRLDVAAEVAEQGLLVLDWRERAQAIVDDLAPKTDLVLCLSHLGFRINSELARSEPRIDVIFGGHFDDSSRETNFENNTPVLVGFIKGARVQRIEWWWQDPSSYFREEQHGELQDISKRVGGAIELEVARYGLADLEGREAELGTKSWTEKRERALQVLANTEAALEERAPWPAGNLFAHMPVPMHRGIERDEAALVLVDEYHGSLDAYWEQRKTLQTAPLEGFPKPEECASCHPEQYEFWLATRHSKAFSTLEATHQEMDAECIGCHTVGYQQREGFASPEQHAGFENVQCAACHGNGKLHMSGGISYIDERRILPGNIGCAVCHNEEHDPKFAEQSERRLPLVACPAMKAPGQGNPALLAALRKAASVLEAQIPTPWDRLSDARWKAGDTAAAAAAAENWLASDPRSMLARMTLAERYLDLDRAAQAVPLFRAVTERQATNWRAWAGLGVALLPSDPAAALEAGLEAYSLQDDRPERVAFVVWCLTALGRNEEAAKRVQEHLQRFPEQRASLEALLQR